MVEHSPHHLKVEGSRGAIASRNGREKNNKKVTCLDCFVELTLAITTLAFKASLQQRQRCHDTQHNNIQQNDTQHNNIQQNDTQHNNIQQNDTQHNNLKRNIMALGT